MRSLSQVCITEESMDKFLFKPKVLRLKSESPSLLTRYSAQAIVLSPESPSKKHKTCTSEIPLSYGKMYVRNGKIQFKKMHLPKLEMPKMKTNFDPKEEIMKWIQANKVPSPPKKRIVFRAIKELSGQNKKSLIF